MSNYYSLPVIRTAEDGYAVQARAAAFQYLQRGFPVFAALPEHKGSPVPGWSTGSGLDTLDKIDNAYGDGTRNNVVVRTGSANNVATFDFDFPSDDPSMYERVYTILGIETAYTSRPSKLVSQVLVVISDMPAAFTRDADGAIEGRGNRHLTLMPPSIRADGEQLRLVGNLDQLAVLSMAQFTALLQRTRAVVDVVILIQQCAKNNPHRPLSRHATILHLAGLLFKAGMPEDAVRQLIEDAVYVSNDSDGMRDDYVRGIGDTAGKLARSEAVAGYSSLSESFGRDVIDDICRHLGITASGSDLPRIPVSGNLVDMTERTLGALNARNASSPILFVHGNVPSRIVTLGNGTHIAQPLTEHATRYEIARSAEFFKVNRSGIPIDVLPPMAVVHDVLAEPNLPLPTLERITGTPVFSPDGSLVSEPGFDPGSGTYLTSGGWPTVPAQPTGQDLERARQLIMTELLGDFPLSHSRDRAHMLALLLAPFIRGLIDGPTPLHLISKPEVGTGASLLADLVHRVATGRDADAMTMGKSEEETRKRLTAIMSENRPIVLLDNLPPHLDSQVLSAALTAGHWSDRILGLSKSGSWPVKCTWIGTGNNVELTKELARRTLPIHLNAQMEQPYLRDPKRFRHPNIRLWATEQRRELVWALLVMIQRWIALGRPAGEPTMGSYEAWAEVTGGILTSAGVEDFLDDIQTQLFALASGGEDRAFIRAWHGAFAASAVTARQLLGMILDTGVEVPLAIDDNPTEKSSRKLGYYLRRLRDRTFDLEPGRLSVVVRFSGSFHNANTWRLEVHNHTTPNDDAPEGSEAAAAAEGTSGDKGTSAQDQKATCPHENRDPARDGDKWDKGDTSSGLDENKIGTCPDTHTQNASEHGEEGLQKSVPLVPTCPQANVDHKNVGDKRATSRSSLSHLSPEDAAYRSADDLVEDDEITLTPFRAE